VSALLLAVATTAGHPTWPDILVFAVGAAAILVGAFGVVLMSNPVHCALSLVMTLFGVAVLFVEQVADFLLAVQVIVYAGAIVVLFLFVIMFLGVDRQENIEQEPLRGQRPLAVLLVFIGLVALLVLAVNSHWVTGAHSVSGPGHGTNVGALGRSIFTTYLFAFEATAALLVIAVVGAVVLARRPPSRLEADEEFEAGEVEGRATGDGDGAGAWPGADGEDGPGEDDQAGVPAEAPVPVAEAAPVGVPAEGAGR
jgi:NADH-quinone oxidoreductase subunit J